MARLKRLCDRYSPESFSEHLGWSSHGGAFLNDFLPLPYDDRTLSTVCDHIDQVPDMLGRRMLLENPSIYVTFQTSTLSETDFRRLIVLRTGCGLLLDVNNVFVSCTNHCMAPRLAGRISAGGRGRNPSGRSRRRRAALGAAVDRRPWIARRGSGLDLICRNGGARRAPAHSDRMGQQCYGIPGPSGRSEPCRGDPQRGWPCASIVKQKRHSAQASPRRMFRPV